MKKKTTNQLLEEILATLQRIESKTGSSWTYIPATYQPSNGIGVTSGPNKCPQCGTTYYGSHYCTTTGSPGITC